MNNEVISQINSGNQESLSLKNNDIIGEKKSNDDQNIQNETNKIEVINSQEWTETNLINIINDKEKENKNEKLKEKKLYLR